MNSENENTLGGDRSAVEEMERAALPVVRSFTVTPEAVETGGSVTVAWKITVPDSEVIYELKLNGQIIGAFGQKRFSNLTQSTDFILSASTEHEERVLRRLRVRVDTPACRWGTPIPAFVITSLLKTEFDKRFSGNSQFKLRGNGTVVTLDVGAIKITVPVEILVEDWFNADMDISIKLSVTGGGGFPVLVLSRGVSLGVSWTFLEHLPGLGCTVFVESGMSKLGEVLMSEIVTSELVPKVNRSFNDQIDKATKEAQEADPQHRVFSLAFFELSSDGVRFKICPK